MKTLGKKEAYSALSILGVNLLWAGIQIICLVLILWTQRTYPNKPIGWISLTATYACAIGTTIIPYLMDFARRHTNEEITAKMTTFCQLGVLAIVCACIVFRFPETSLQASMCAILFTIIVTSGDSIIRFVIYPNYGVARNINTR